MYSRLGEYGKPPVFIMFGDYVKKLLAILLMSLSVNAYAENWTVIGDSNTGSRLLVDASTFNLDKTKSGKYNVYALMKIVNTDKLPSFLAVIDGVQCLSNKSGNLVMVYEKQESIELYWSINGDKLYDMSGAWLCGKLNAEIYQNSTKKKEPEKLYM